VMEFGTLEAIFACVSAGLGITLLPKALVGPVCSAGRLSLHSLSPTEALVETVFLRRRDAFCSSALAALLGKAKAAFHGEGSLKSAQWADEDDRQAAARERVIPLTAA
jgi:LysR family transcriptional regulator, cell division regulator